MNWQASEFWQFSLDCYQQKQHQFLQLQDNFNLNVNLLLFAKFADKQNRLLTVTQWQQIIVSIEQSNQIIQQHRKTRRLARNNNSSLYKKLLEQELQLEQNQQQQIINTVNNLQIMTEIKPNNAGPYCIAAGIDVTPPLVERFHQLNN
ncbi:TIGR02444 family protein [Neptunicella marina]|uniref:TIGR02444 family protein n=1 Tax=Neptunicella marina TaxID=2125989 RepID=A0A8J6IUX2_9ALTE|nr:TIGR02444 family protein [Neptunicella marina]MBC3765943.1 TIGR02444 family protein [Neptunicella marina]